MDIPDRILLGVAACFTSRNTGTYDTGNIRGVRAVGWEFVTSFDSADERFYWFWRRTADDSGAVLEESARFLDLLKCIENARQNGFQDPADGLVDL